MTSFTFYRENGLFVGFRLLGHCSTEENDFEGRLVCAAVSSAAQLAANTVSEVLRAALSEEYADESTAEIRLRVKNPEKASSDIIDGLRFHINELAKQFPSRVSLNIDET